MLAQLFSSSLFSAFSSFSCLPLLEVAQAFVLRLAHKFAQFALKLAPAFGNRADQTLAVVALVAGQKVAVAEVEPAFEDWAAQEKMAG